LTSARCDRHALLLAAGKLRRVVVGPLGEADLRELLAGAVHAARPRGDPRRASGSSTLSSAVVRGSRLNCWNTKPILRLRIDAERVRVERRDVLAVEAVRAGRRRCRGSRSRS
jgi:hypothetical protein